jgi:hypothetical protein
VLEEYVKEVSGELHANTVSIEREKSQESQGRQGRHVNKYVLNELKKFNEYVLLSTT